MLTERLEFVPARDAEAFAAAPAAPAVFLLRSDDPQAEPYVSKTANLRRRLHRLLGPPEQTRRLNLRDRVHSIEYNATGSDFESGFLLYGALRQTFPKTYSDRLRLRFAPLLKLHLENEYPRASITTRLGRLGGRSLYYGPFPSRTAAEKFANDSLDFFKMRRCVDDLHPDPQFPGCIYSEMKMCLAPCFKGCTDEAYAAEVARVRDYFDSSGQSLLRELEAERERLSADLDFEGAAAQHAKVAKVKSILSACDDICGRIDRLDAVIIQPSFQEKSVTLFRFHGCELNGPAAFAIEAEDTQQTVQNAAITTEAAPAQAVTAQPTEKSLRAALESMASKGSHSAQRFGEELAILKRWYYRTHKTGEIFFANDRGELPLRRIARGVSRVYRGEKEAALSPQAEEGRSEINESK